MAIYLQVRATSIHLMLDALHVHEVLNLDTTQAGIGNHVQWRDDVISTVNLAKLFGLPGGNIAMGVIYTTGNESRPIMLLIDDVIGLKDMPVGHWSALPRIPPESARFFSSVWLEESSNRQSFRLHHPLNNSLFGISA